jgi:hypothetical protein
MFVAWDYGNADAMLTERADSKLVTLAPRGVLTAETMGRMQSDSSSALAASAPDGVVVDFTRAVMAMGLDFYASMRPTVNYWALPAAMVVSPADLPDWLAYAARMSAQGVIRGAFTDAAQASRWVEAQAWALRRQRMWVDSVPAAIC